LGTVTSDEVEVAGNTWGSIEEWKNKYDTAIEKLIK
jgi:phosphoribosylformylglycinamidine synthase